MLDNRLIEADATKLDELREMLKAQENSDKLCGIGMKEIHIEHGAAKKVCQAVKSLTDGKKVLMVTGPFTQRPRTRRRFRLTLRARISSSA